MSNNIVFHFSDQIKTNYTGYTQLSRFYHFCLGHPPNSTFHLDFTNVEWFDGNLCALLSAMGYYLNRNFGHTFTTDTQVIMKRFDVLYRNGFFAGDSNVVDERQSTVPIHCFNCSDLNGFCNYIENKLLNHRGVSTP